jgi:hypothetical protein
MTTQTKKIAHATPTSPTSYTVTYEGSRDMDREVSYPYLRSLAAKGWEVHVGGVAYTPAHVIPVAK